MKALHRLIPQAMLDWINAPAVRIDAVAGEDIKAGDYIQITGKVAMAARSPEPSGIKPIKVPYGFFLDEEGRRIGGSWTFPTERMGEMSEPIDKSEAADAKRFRWLLDGNGYFMEEQGLCGPWQDADDDSERERARIAIDKAMKCNPERETPRPVSG